MKRTVSVLILLAALGGCGGNLGPIWGTTRQTLYFRNAASLPNAIDLNLGLYESDTDPAYDYAGKLQINGTGPQVLFGPDSSGLFRPLHSHYIGLFVTDRADDSVFYFFARIDLSPYRGSQVIVFEDAPGGGYRFRVEAYSP